MKMTDHLNCKELMIQQIFLDKCTQRSGIIKKKKKI